jgi:hypothetical protein
MSELAHLFARQKYVVWRSCVKDPHLSLLYKYACMRAEIGTMNIKDDQVPGTPSTRGDFIMDGLLMDLLPLAQDISRLKLFPTYSYFRVYKRGDVLSKHTDRPACEISVTLCLGYRAERPWPIWIEGPTGAVSAELEPGDGLLYRGVECAHWREPFIGEQAAQVFLHYVDQNGPNAEWKFDKRPGLASLGPGIRGIRS